jgi:regulator of nucleoside diphosphate kinase
MYATPHRPYPTRSAIPVITEMDAAKIRELAARLPDRGRGVESLPEFMAMVTTEADIVPRDAVGADIVTLNSTVSFRDEQTETEHVATIVHPNEAAPAERRISVLSPMGMALLGRRAGSLTECAMPDGTRRAIRVLELHYQPEAAGDLDR